MLGVPLPIRLGSSVQRIRVQLVVIQMWQALKVPYVIVGAVLIHVMDIIPIWNWTVVKLPYVAVQ